jgi:serine/threonine protein kinase
MVAVKILKQSATPESESEFRAEMQLMCKLRHPNLVQIMGVVTATKPEMIILEYLPGGALDKWLQLRHDTDRAVLDLESQLYILYQVALGMSALHALNIIHRDLAARNVLIGVGLVCKVADFGLSREADSGQEYYRFKSNHSLPLRWMAPEV